MKRFDVGAAILAVTPGVFLLYNVTDNPNYYNADGAQPTVDVWLYSWTVTVNNACKVEVGLARADRTGFVPYYATYATGAIAGGIVKPFGAGLPKLTMSDVTVNQLALRITVGSNSSVSASGDVEIGTV